MAIQDFYNETVDIKRIVPTGSTVINDDGGNWNEIATTDLIVGTDILCSIQDVSESLFDNMPPGDVAEIRREMFCDITVNVQTDDRVFWSGEEWQVVSVADAAGRGHHYEIRIERQKTQ